MDIIWSKEAVADYHENIEYLLEEWSESVAINFIEEVESVIDIIEKQPEIFPMSDHQSVRRAVIRKQITLFYKIIDNRVYLLRFWNNYKDPKSRKL